MPNGSRTTTTDRRNPVASKSTGRASGRCFFWIAARRCRARLQRDKWTSKRRRRMAAAFLRECGRRLPTASSKRWPGRADDFRGPLFQDGGGGMRGAPREIFLAANRRSSRSPFIRRKSPRRGRGLRSLPACASQRIARVLRRCVAKALWDAAFGTTCDFVGRL